MTQDVLSPNHQHKSNQVDDPLLTLKPSSLSSNDTKYAELTLSDLFNSCKQLATNTLEYLLHSPKRL